MMVAGSQDKLVGSQDIVYEFIGAFIFGYQQMKSPSSSR
jgi:hypothetical protein